MKEQHERWADERRRRGLEPGTSGYLAVGRPTLLEDARLVGAVLPPDPLNTSLDFDSATQDLMRSRLSGTTANAVSLLDAVRITNDAVLRTAYSGESGTRAYIAVTRSGGAEVGFGESSAHFSKDGSNLFRLPVLVHAIRVLIETQTAILRHRPASGPFEILLTLKGTRDGVLSVVASGWQEPLYCYPVPSCLEPDLLIRLQVDDWPVDSDGELRLIERYADRICNAFGILQRIYAPNSDGSPGHLDPSYA